MVSESRLGGSAPAGVLLAAVLVLPGCGEPESAERPSAPTSAGRESPAPALWLDVTEEAGLGTARHDAGRRGEFYYPEMTAPGAALFDFDADGDLDLFLVQSADLRPRLSGGTSATSPVDGDALAASHRLLRNDSAGGREALRFTDVTAASGIVRRRYGQGVAVGDVDNDGLPDLYVTNFGANELWRNLGGGWFEEVPSAGGADDDRWGQSAVFFDFDRDGWLDLWVTNYLRYELHQVRPCFSPRGQRDYCGPTTYPGASDVLYRNVGGGRFEDVSAAAGISTTLGSSMGVVAVDFDRDGWLDVYVTNDQRPNHLWHNRGDGTFEEVGLFSGTALNGGGVAESSMGVDSADVDGDLDFDLVLTHLAGETNTVYRNDRESWFVDHSLPSGLGAPSLSHTGFGVVFSDFDLDGNVDLAVANGSVRLGEEHERSGDPWPYREPDQLYRGAGDGTFEEITKLAGEAWRREEVGRSLAAGDLDNDGDADLLFGNVDGPWVLLRNQMPADDAAWIGATVTNRSGSAALGAVVTLLSGAEPAAAEEVAVARVRSDGSYLSAQDPRVVFALPSDGEVGAGVAVRSWLEVQWPSGAPRRERFGPFDGKAGYRDLVQGTGAESAGTGE